MRFLITEKTRILRIRYYYQWQMAELRFKVQEAWQWLAIAQLVNWHMAPLNSWSRSPKAQEKDVKLLGLSMYYDILAIHEADMNTH